MPAGTQRRFATAQKFGSYREDSGHSAGLGGKADIATRLPNDRDPWVNGLEGD
jgi:hypothetical protein